MIGVRLSPVDNLPSEQHCDRTTVLFDKLSTERSCFSVVVHRLSTFYPQKVLLSNFPPFRPVSEGGLAGFLFKKRLKNSPSPVEILTFEFHIGFRKLFHKRKRPSKGRGAFWREILRGARHTTVELSKPLRSALKPSRSSSLYDQSASASDPSSAFPRTNSM